MTAKLKRFSSLLFLALIPALPFFEIYRTFFGGAFHLFGFSAEEFLLLFWVGLILLGGLLSPEKTKKGLIFAFFYLALFFVFAALHAINTAKFNQSLIPDGAPNLFRELYYTVRCYLAPILLIATAPLLSLSKKEITHSLKTLALLVSLGIVLPCVTGLSYASYLEGNEMVHGSFFSWFSLPESASYAAYTARGFFPRANSVGAVLFALSPLVTHWAAEKKKAFDLILFFLTGFACICVGTKIASFGFFLASAAVLFAHLVFPLIKKEKINLKGLLIPALLLVVLLPLFLFSPGFHLQMQREEEKVTAERDQNHFEEIAHLAAKESLSEEDVALLSNYLSDHGYDHFVDPWFPALYPAESDPEFWLLVLSREGKENSNARNFKTELLARIREKNQNDSDSLFGMGFTSGIPYAERDFVHQYYQFGAVGLAVLLFPFLFSFLKILRNLFLSLLKKEPNASLFALALSLFVFFAAAYFAGHVLDTIFSTYVLSLFCAFYFIKEK